MCPAKTVRGLSRQARGENARARINLHRPAGVAVRREWRRNLQIKVHRAAVALGIDTLCRGNHAVGEVGGAALERQAAWVAGVIGVRILLEGTANNRPGIIATGAGRPRLNRVGGHRFEEHHCVRGCRSEATHSRCA